MNYPNDFINKIICGDSLHILREIPNNSIDLILCSPPYDLTRAYNGFTFNFKGIAQHLYRILKEGGVLVWIVGDQTVKGSESGTSFRQALYFMELNMLLYDTMIYAKSNPIPKNHRRYEQQAEFMFILSKGIPKTFNPILEDSKYAGTINKGTMRNSGKDDLQLKHGHNKPVKERKIKGNIWFYSVGYGKTAKDKLAFEHPAVFPLQLAKDCITSWTNPQDIVLDPFMGSGQTALACIELNRNYIGVDISQEYCELAEKRILQKITDSQVIQEQEANA